MRYPEGQEEAKEKDEGARERNRHAESVGDSVHVCVCVRV